MPAVVLLELGFCLPESGTLKDKRAVVSSMVRRGAARFGVSVAEVGALDDHRFGEVAAAVVCSDGDHAEQVLRNLLAFWESNYPIEVGTVRVERR